RREAAFVIGLLLIAFAVSASGQSSDQGRRPPVLRSTNAVPDNQDQSEAGRQSGPATLITVPAIVMDRNGRYVANLRKEDFAIYENGVEQNLSSFISVEKPFTVALMLDVSGSTKYQLDEIRQAANTFVSRLRLSDRMMVVTFDGKVNLLADVADVRAIRQSKLHIPAVTDGTALYDAVAFALKRMAQVPGRKAIVLMTDGVDQNSVATLQSTVAGIAEQDVLIYTVQYNTLPQTSARLSFIKNEKARRKVEQRLLKQYATSEPYLRTLAEKTGGRFYKAEDLREVGPAFEAITAELGVQYSLGYYPKGNSTAGAERSIKVRVRYPNLVVRTRDSYTTSPAIARQ
ncbi:MAG TPA: VWA domain-containing protein, partial [Pyrinomonadaceae bacterium]|nr:VWA domain-containing protein [Pyrinomonadaceae bacterium]